MGNLGEELRKHRHEKKASLEDISNKTKINVKYLTEIESNNFEFLSKPYVIAFVREYSQYIKLDPDEIIERLKTEVFQEIEKKQPQPKAEQKDEPVKEKVVIDSAGSVSLKREKPWSLYFIFAIIIIALVLILKFVIFKSNDDHSNLYSSEISENVKNDTVSTMKNTDPRSIPQDTEIVPPKEEKTLIAVSIDTIWAMIVQDTLDAAEYIFYPDDRREFTFYDSIWLRIGKSTGLRLVLNDEIYENFGPENTLVWELLITEHGIQRRVLRNRTTQ